MGRRSGKGALIFCVSVAINAFLFLRINHCFSLQPRHSGLDRHKANSIIVADIFQGYGSSSCNTDRRKILQQLCGSAMAFGTVGSSPPLSFASTTSDSNNSVVQHPFIYSDSWTGTSLNIMSLEASTERGAYSSDESGLYWWAMGKWPDPALRIPAKPVDPAMWLNTKQQERLGLAATILRDTARREGAVGLAAQQCGVDARMVFLSASGRNADIVLINPRIVARSPESSMKVWTEECLVLPPTFRATVLRDDWIDVEYDFFYEYRPSTKELISSAGSQSPMKRRFFREQSRCLQHELDHDRGILITDHVGLDELENDLMRRIETVGHDRRQTLAYARH